MRAFFLSALCLTFALTSAACNGTGPQVVTNSNTNSATAGRTDPISGKPQTAIAHTTENSPPAGDTSAQHSPSGQSGTPIDTTDLDAAVAKAEKGGDKKALSAAYLARADALTKAQQYRSALGDYRRALKADPSNEAAQQWIDKIMGIYQSMGREAPKEGEEPPPLPFKKQ